MNVFLRKISMMLNLSLLLVFFTLTYGCNESSSTSPEEEKAEEAGLSTRTKTGMSFYLESHTQQYQDSLLIRISWKNEQGEPDRINLSKLPNGLEFESIRLTNQADQAREIWFSSFLRFTVDSMKNGKLEGRGFQSSLWLTGGVLNIFPWDQIGDPVAEAKVDFAKIWLRDLIGINVSHFPQNILDTVFDHIKNYGGKNQSSDPNSILFFDQFGTTPGASYTAANNGDDWGITAYRSEFEGKVYYEVEVVFPINEIYGVTNGLPKSSHAWQMVNVHLSKFPQVFVH